MSQDSHVSQISYANERLRWFLREILYSDTWEKHPENKVILARVMISQLEDEDCYWQAERLRNHLHLWMKRQKVVYGAEGADTLRESEEAQL